MSTLQKIQIQGPGLKKPGIVVLQTLFIGFFGTGVGAAFGYGWDQLIAQAIGAFSVLTYSFVLSLIIGFAIEKTIGFRVKSEKELAGVDLTEHAESAYEMGGILRGGR